MNKIIAVALFLTVAMNESSFGQFSLNFSSGVNQSNYKFQNFGEMAPESRLGYFLGIAPGYQISKKVKLIIDFQYSLKGYKTDTDNNLTPSEYRFSYLDFIPEIEYSLMDYLAIGVGMNYGLKLKEQFKIGSEDWSDSNGLELIKSTDFGLTGKLKVNYNNIFGFVRYNFGMKDISDVMYTDGNGQTIDNTKQLNRNLQIGLGYTLNLKSN